MTLTPPLPPEDADVAAVKAGIGIVGNNVTAWAALDRLAARLQEAKRERDEERERFHRHVEEMIEPKIIARAEATERERDQLRLDAESRDQDCADVKAATKAREAALREALERTCALEESYTGETSPSRAVLATADPGASE